MATPAPSDPNSQQPQPAAIPAPEHQLHEFWVKNSSTVYVVCGLVIVGILAWGGLKMYKKGEEGRIGQAYAAATTTEKLKSFAAQNAGHELAGVAHLRLADEAYAAGNYTQAAASYKTAAETLKKGPLGGRAYLGRAISVLQGGSASEAESLLKAIAADAAQLNSVRAEAYYHLASLAASAGRIDEANKYLEQLTAVEPMGLWAQRAMSLRLSLAASGKETTSAPSLALPAKP